MVCIAALKVIQPTDILVTYGVGCPSLHGFPVLGVFVSRNSNVAFTVADTKLSSCEVTDHKSSDPRNLRKPGFLSGVTWFEWPTLLLFVCVYVGWILAVSFHEALPVWLLLPALALLTTLHSSLQHEALHGHPTRSGRFNECLAAIPLGLFIPYRRFKRLHLRHHCDENLTDPYDDPESFYLARLDWMHLSFGMRCLLSVNNTLLGRLMIGPVLSLFAFYCSELKLLSTASKERRCLFSAWALHASGVVCVLAILVLAGFPVWLYLGVAYAAMSLLMLRTYAEHQAAENVGPRTAIVEASPFFALLYLNNNLHFVHHRFPGAPWYHLPKIYREHYLMLNAQNDHYRISGYWALFRLYFIRAKEPVAHPLRRVLTSEVVASDPEMKISSTVLTRNAL